jgi:hypothetical protein
MDTTQASKEEEEEEEEEAIQLYHWHKLVHLCGFVAIIDGAKR